MSATTSPADETERLRRHLRALSAVNRQLHAQLESGVARVVECLDAGPSVLVLDGGHPIGVLTRSDVLGFLAVRSSA